MKNHPDGRHFRVTVLRVDGTPWILKGIKHVLFRNHVLELYQGEHNINRVRICIPWQIVDHFSIEEES